MSLNYRAEQQALGVSRPRSVPCIIYTLLYIHTDAVTEPEFLTDACPEPQPLRFLWDIYNCKYQICFLWTRSSVYLKPALLAKAFASEHLCRDVLGTWTWMGTATEPKSLKAKTSVHRTVHPTLQLYYFCFARRSNLCEYDCPWATGTKWSSRSWRKPGKACLVSGGSAHPYIFPIYIGIYILEIFL